MGNASRHLLWSRIMKKDQGYGEEPKRKLGFGQDDEYRNYRNNRRQHHPKYRDYDGEQGGSYQQYYDDRRPRRRYGPMEQYNDDRNY